MIIIIIILFCIVFAVVLLKVSSRKTELIKAGINPDNALIIRLRPSYLRRMNNINAYVEFLEDEKIKVYYRPLKQEVITTKDKIIGIGLDESLLGQAQIYLDVSGLDIRNVPGLFDSGVIEPISRTSRKSTLYKKIKYLAATHSIPIVPLQYQSDTYVSLFRFGLGLLIIGSAIYYL